MNPQPDKQSSMSFFNKYAKGTQKSPSPIDTPLVTEYSNKIANEPTQPLPSIPFYQNITPPPTLQGDPFGLTFKEKQLLINQPYIHLATQKPTQPSANTVQAPFQPAQMFKKHVAPINESLQPRQPTYIPYAAKQVQYISPQPAIKALKRTNSFDEQHQQQPSVNAPKQFKKQDFAIGKKLGKGQYGEVMLVVHKLTGFLCGLKVMSKQQIKAQKYQNQIARQLSINFFLDHPNIAPLYGYFHDEQNIYLLVEYCTGGQLLSLLRKNMRLEDNQTSPIIRQICEGLTYVHHQQIIHRDIKPENILFNFDTVKICDFGWAVFSANGMRKTISGSPLYYSPQIVMETAYDEKIDIWSVGMMTYECLLGKTPFRVYTEMDLKRIVEDEIKFPEYVDVTDDAKDFILRIMKKRPEERMEMRDIMHHPFITKHLNTGKVSGQIIEDFRRVLG